MNLESLESRTLLAGCDLDTEVNASEEACSLESQENTTSWSETAYEYGLDAADMAYDAAVVAKDVLTTTAIGAVKGALAGVTVPHSLGVGLGAVAGGLGGGIVSTLVSVGVCDHDDQCTKGMTDIGMAVGGIAGAAFGGYTAFKHINGAKILGMDAYNACLLTGAGIGVAAEVYKTFVNNGEDTFVTTTIDDFNLINLFKARA